MFRAHALATGKTIGMLEEGQRLRALGADVVIAIVEGHNRPVTQARAAGLEIVPRLASEYHGANFEEMDLDGVLRRNSGVALADELAHTNVPGAGGSAKRWQDVLDLLDTRLRASSAELVRTRPAPLPGAALSTTANLPDHPAAARRCWPHRRR